MNFGKLPQKIVVFLKEVSLEMKKVNWPTREQTVNYTLIVIAVSLAVAIFLGGFDFIFTDLRNCYILRIEPCYMGKLFSF